MSDLKDAGLKLAIYARVSTEEQREGQTIDSQVAELERFAREKGWAVVGVFKDDGWSGGVLERPELDRLRDSARAQLIEAVLVNDVDRLARDVSHLGIIKRELERIGVRLMFRKLPTESSPTYNLMVNILGSFAEFERELISDRTRRGRRHKVETRKQYLGCNTVYGYRYRPSDRIGGTDGVLEVDPEQSRIVQQMFTWVDRDGLSARRVMVKLNDLGIKPQRSRRWGKSSVLRVLHCETYAGLWHYNKHQSYEPTDSEIKHRYRRRAKCRLRVRPRSEWIPWEVPEELRLISREQWEHVQQRISANRVFSPRNEQHRYLLKGLVGCGGCGGTFVGDPCHGKYYYRCSKRCKKVPTIRENALDYAVKKAVAETILNPRLLRDAIKEVREQQVLDGQRAKATAENFNRESGRIQIEEGRVLEGYRLGVLSPAQLAQQLEVLKSKRAALDSGVRARDDSLTLPSGDKAELTVEDYCLKAKANLGQFGFDEWQGLIRTIIHSIRFEGDRLTIRARIPLPGDGNETASNFIPVTQTQLLG